MKARAVFTILIILSQPLFSQDINSIKKELVGKTYIYPYSLDIVNKYGSPETLTGTTSTQWRAYFPKGKFTMLMNKSNDKITNVLAGKVPG